MGRRRAAGAEHAWGAPWSTGAPAINAPGSFIVMHACSTGPSDASARGPSLYSTWSRRGGPARPPGRARRSPIWTLGRSIGADVAPVGDAWQRVRAGAPDPRAVRPRRQPPRRRPARTSPPPCSGAPSVARPQSHSRRTPVVAPFRIWGGEPSRRHTLHARRPFG